MSLYSYITNILPHGNGINGDYMLEVKKDKITVYNVWDNMNENGYYDGVFKFSITYYADGRIILHFHGLNRNEYKKIADTDLRSYLEDLYYAHVPMMVNILNQKVSVYENDMPADNFTSLERGFLETMIQDAEYNFSDDKQKNIPDYAMDELQNYPFTVKNIDKRSLDYCLEVIRDIGKTLPETTYSHDIGGEIYLAICYGETENPIAKKIAISDKYWKFGHASKEISYDVNGKYRIFVE